jgi:hypothetical protein
LGKASVHAKNGESSIKTVINGGFWGAGVTTKDTARVLNLMYKVQCTMYNVQIKKTPRDARRFFGKYFCVSIIF